MTKEKNGIVYLVGGGPGDPGLITVRGADLIRRADVVVHDRIMGHELLADVRADAVIVYAGKKPGDHRGKQDELNRLMIEYARGGATVVRLKGGDPFVFGRGFEELVACRDAGIDCVVVPGVSSAFAVPAVAGIPITSRQLVRSVAVISARTAHDSTAPPLDYAALARIDTLCVLMGRSSLDRLAADLIKAGRDPDTPAAAVEWGTTYKQRVTKATLSGIAVACEEDGLHAPIVVVVGEAADCAVEDFNASRRTLAGTTVFVPHRLAPKNPLRRRLSATGATLLACDLVAVSPLDDSMALDQALVELDQYDWIVFASPHAVRFFFDRLLATGRDGRALAACKLGVFDDAARRALRRRGMREDAVFKSRSATGSGMNGLHTLQGATVLGIEPETPDGTLREGFRRAGIGVRWIACFRCVGRELPASLRERIRDRVDIAVLTTADNVRCFLDAIPNARSIPVVCTSPEAARQAEALGLSVAAGEPTGRPCDVFHRIETLLGGHGAGSRPTTENTAPLEVQ